MHVNAILDHPKFEKYRDRFWSRVDSSGGPNACWPWTAGLDTTTGYGLMGIRGSHRTHRIAWVLTNGPIPPKAGPRGYCICHRCDNRVCCNPAHLFLGTDRDNALDATHKGRMAQGEQHYAAKLTAEQVRLAREDPRSARIVAAEFGVKTGTIIGVRKVGSWPSLGPYTPTRTHADYVLRGSEVMQSNLTEEQVYAIRADARTVDEIAADNDVSKGTVSAIKDRKTWRHLPVRPEDVPAARLRRGPKPGAGNGQPGRLAQLRRAVEDVLAQREEMDEGWFVPAATMEALKRTYLS